MRTILYTALVALMFPLQLVSQNNLGSYAYDLSENLDLTAIATVFAQAKNMKDFENKLNDYRNQVSNLDLNNDGYVDYLRVLKLYESNQNVILIQAVLDNNYFQDVATILVGRDVYNREYIQIIGEPALFGEHYILEPTFVSRPRVVQWLWTYPTTIYVSQYYWGYYPRVYRYRTVLPILAYHRHLGTFINVHHHYHFTTYVRYSNYNHIVRTYSRNDYWRNNPTKRFDQRNSNYQNKGSLQGNNQNNKPNNTGNTQPNTGTTNRRPEPRVTPSDNRATTTQRDRPTVAPRQIESRTQPTASPTTTRQPTTVAKPSTTTTKPAVNANNRTTTTTTSPAVRSSSSTQARPATTTTAKPAVSTPSRTVTTTLRSSTSSSSSSSSSSSTNSTKRESTTTSRPSGNRR